MLVEGLKGAFGGVTSLVSAVLNSLEGALSHFLWGNLNRFLRWVTPLNSLFWVFLWGWAFSTGGDMVEHFGGPHGFVVSAADFGHSSGGFV